MLSIDDACSIVSSVVAGVARLGVFLQHIKACLRCVLNCERAVFTNIRMNTFTIMFIRQKYICLVHVQNMNELMNDHSLNAFRHNTGSVSIC